MENKEISGFSFSGFIEYIKQVVAMYEKENENKYIDIHKDLDIVENRINDEDLYLGVVGSFSSGKSTFINSVIQKNLLPTDAVQGTTVAASILKRACYDDLEIQYMDGSVKKFSESSVELSEKYGIDYKLVNNANQKISLFRRFVNWIKKLIGIRILTDEDKATAGNARIELFKKVIATEELAADIKRVTLYYQNENIPYRIALVDTPGTESLNKRHNDVTKSAIDEICDAIVVIIPYDEPVSEELISYVNNNLEKSKSECIFVVTKVELLGDKDELSQLIRVIKKRLENGLSIEHAIVIPMPTLIYLKSVDLEMKMTFLDNMPESEKKDLIAMYEDGISQIKRILEEKRNDYIKRKIVEICERVNDRLNSNLTEVVDDYDEKNRELLEKTVPPIAGFENKIEKVFETYVISLKNRVSGEVSLMTMPFSELRDYIDKVLNGCSDSQDLISQLNFGCRDTIDKVQDKITDYLGNVVSGCNQKIKELKTAFDSDYIACGVKGGASVISVDVRNFFTADFVDECEELLQDEVEGIKSTIRNETNGFFKKVKSFFSNPFGKHKDMASSRLCNVVDQIRKKVVLYVQNGISSRIDMASRDSQNSLKQMVRRNAEQIDEYIARTNQSISENARGKAETQAHIDRLNQYIETIKEAN